VEYTPYDDEGCIVVVKPAPCTGEIIKNSLSENLLPNGIVHFIIIGSANRQKPRCKVISYWKFKWTKKPTFQKGVWLALKGLNTSLNHC